MYQNSKPYQRHAMIALLAGTVLTSSAFAQSAPAADSGDIIVTATKREESLQKVPISIQALSAKKLEEHQVTSFDDYAKLLPSVSYQSFGPGQSQIYFRGITSGSDSNGSHSGSQPTSALYLDEVPLTTIGGAVDLHVYDMQRVEALSGPQGTLFGSSSLSGTLRLITNKPTHKFEAGFDVSGTTFGKGSNSSGGSFDGFINIPLTPTIAFRGSAFYERDGGYISNIPGTRTYQVFNAAGNAVPLTVNNAPYVKKNFNDVETFGGRAALGIDLNDNWTAAPTIIYQNQKAHGAFLFGPKTGDQTVPGVGDLQVQDFTPDYNTDEWTQAALTIHGKLSTWDVTYAAGYFERHVDNQADYSDYSVNYQNQTYAGAATYYNSFIDKNGKNLDPSQHYHGHDDYTKQTHELRISSPSADRFRLTAGLFYQRQTDHIYGDYFVPGTASVVPPSSSFYQTSVPKCGDDVFCTRVNRVDRDYAAFTDAAFDLLPNLTIDGGIRAFIANNTASGFSGGASKLAGCIATSNDPGVPCILFSKKAVQSGETHKINVSWKVARDKLLYFTYSTGYRPGGVNRLVQVLPYAPDTLSNYEIGFKTAWFNHKLTLNASIFDEEWKDVQYALTTPNSTGVLSVYNVGNARVKGIEGDFSLTEGPLTLSGSGSYIDAKTTTNFCNIDANPGDALYGNPNCAYIAPGATTSIIVPSGTILPIQPKFKGNITARYKFNLGSAKAFIQATGNHQSGVRSALDQPSSNAYNTAYGPIKGFSTVDFSVGAAIGKWKWEAYVQNAFDERGVLSLNSACIPSACAVYARAYPTKPQEFGVKLGTKF